MKQPLVAFFYIIIVAGCIGGVSRKETINDQYYLERRRSLDIIDLIDLLITPDTACYNAGDYAKGANILQIKWDDKPLMGANNVYHDLMARNGDVYITMDSIFTAFVLSDRRKPVPWTVTLSGPMAGYMHISLRNNVVSHEFAGFEDYFRKKNILLSVSESPCESYVRSCAIKKMRVRINNREINLAELVDTGGNSGADVSVFLNTDGSPVSENIYEIAHGLLPARPVKPIHKGAHSNSL